MKKHLNRLKDVFSLSFVVLIISCNINELEFDDINVPNYTAEVAAPIGDVTYTVRELIDKLDSTIEVNESASKLLTVVYRDTSIFDDPSDFISVGQIVNNDDLNPSISFPASASDETVSFSESFQFKFQPSEDELLDSAFYKSGSAELQVQSSFNSDLSYTLKIVDFKNTITGDTLTFIDNNLAANGTSIRTENLVNFKTAFNRVGGENIFNLTFEGVLDVKAGESVNPTDFLSFTLTIDNPEFISLFGFFGSNASVIQDQSIELDFFEDIEPGGLEFNTPEINFTIENSFGIPVGVLMEGISSSNTSGDEVMLTGNITDTIAVRAPEITDVGTSAISAISINNDNSNLRSLLSIAPDSISFPITGVSNFGNVDGAETNFLTDSSFLKTFVEVNIPLDVRLNGFTRDFDFDISSINFDEADSIKIRVQTINALPISGTMFMNLLNDAGDIIYQIPNTLILQSPEVNSIDKTEEPFHNTSFVKLDPDGVAAFANATKISLTMVIDSHEATNGTFVKVFSDYELIIKLSALANLNVDL